MYHLIMIFYLFYNRKKKLRKDKSGNEKRENHYHNASIYSYLTYSIHIIYFHNET